MFRKPVSVKSNNQLKSSDKKKLRERIRADFRGLTDETLALIIPSKSELTVAKLASADYTFIAYCRDRVPLFFEFENKLYPTLNFLWEYPGVVPTLVIMSPVFERLHNGADLMVPGLVLPPSPEEYLSNLHLQPSFPCACALVGNGAAVVVGQVLMGSDSILISGGKGRAMKVLHTLNDRLCEFYHLPSSPPELPCSLLAYGLKDLVEDQVDALQIDDNQLESDPVEPPKECKLTDEERIRLAFLQALKHRAGKSEPLPILANVFYAKFLLPLLHAMSDPPDIKKTEYKKVSSFFEAMQDEGLVKLDRVGEGAQAVLSISEVCWTHEELRRVPAIEAEVAEQLLEEEDSEENPTVGYSLPEIRECLSVSAAFLPVCTAVDPSVRKNDLITEQTVRKIVTDYVRKENLVSENGRMVILDPVLAGILKEETLSWQQLFEAVMSKLQPAFEIKYKNGRTILHRCRIPLITIEALKRKGKMITRVDNLKLYGIEAGELAKYVRLKRACSTTLHEPQLAVAAALGQECGEQMQCQGDQSEYLARLLIEGFGIPKKFVSASGAEDTTRRKK